MAPQNRFADAAVALRSLASSERGHAKAYQEWADDPNTLPRHRRRYEDLAADALTKAHWAEVKADQKEALAEELDDAKQVAA